MFENNNAVKYMEVNVNMTPKGYEGLGKQGMLFHQACFELCDNALAAAKDGEMARISIALAPGDTKDSLWVAISDCSHGMGPTILDDSLQMGSLSTGNNRLHEHGFGLKNALACLVPGGDWTIYTRQDTSQDYLQVSGPFDTKMSIYKTPTLELPAGLNLKWPDPSTVVLMRVPMKVARTVQRQGKQSMTDLVTLRSWLVEHLGVTYRGYLEMDPVMLEPSAKIVVTIGENEVLVPPMPVPMMLAKSEMLQVELNGAVVPIRYTHGILDEEARNSLVLGKKSKYYYKGNQPTQGIDIRLGKRVISTAQLDQIWYQEDGKPVTRHNQYNDFVGELLIPELPRGVLSTLNNKTDINRADEDWDVIFAVLQEFQPEKNGKVLREEDVKIRWMQMLQATCPEDTVTREVSVWDTGARIDVRAENGDKCVLYEVKIHKATPQDLYQLKMYWDGLVVEGRQPTEAVLLASSFSDNLNGMLNVMNQMPAPYLPSGAPSAPYNLKIATLKEKHLV